MKKSNQNRHVESKNREPKRTVLIIARIRLGVQGWCDGENTRLPPLWPVFDSWTRRHMWVEFVAGSHPCAKGFSLGTPVFRPL